MSVRWPATRFSRKAARREAGSGWCSVAVVAPREVFPAAAHRDRRFALERRLDAVDGDPERRVLADPAAHGHLLRAALRSLGRLGYVGRLGALAGLHSASSARSSATHAGSSSPGRTTTSVPLSGGGVDEGAGGPAHLDGGRAPAPAWSGRACGCASQRSSPSRARDRLEHRERPRPRNAHVSAPFAASPTCSGAGTSARTIANHRLFVHRTRPCRLVP